MKRFHWIHELVPITTVILSVLALMFGVNTGAAGFFLLALLIPYLFPLLLHRFQIRVSPIPLGATLIERNTFHPWLASHRIQKLYILFPTLEKVLMLIPGLYPAWLRAWGAKVGSNVYFAPTVRIHDRSLVEIGNHVVIGDETVLVSHMITRQAGQTRVICLPVKIGAGKLVGGYSLMAPGSSLVNLDQLPSHSLCPVDSTDEFFSLSKFGMQKLREKKESAESKVTTRQNSIAHLTNTQ